MNLHEQIMNLRGPSATGFARGTSGDDGYRMGHRDARHAAAELALAADSLRDELLTVAKMIDAHYSGSLDHQPAYVKMARKVLAQVLVSG